MNLLVQMGSRGCSRAPRWNVVGVCRSPAHLTPAWRRVAAWHEAAFSPQVPKSCSHWLAPAVLRCSARPTDRLFPGGGQRTGNWACAGAGWELPLPSQELLLACCSWVPGSNSKGLWLSTSRGPGGSMGSAQPQLGQQRGVGRAVLVPVPVQLDLCGWLPVCLGSGLALE